MTRGTIVVLGATADALALAASLARDGREVVLWDGLPPAPAEGRGCLGYSIRLREPGGEFHVKLAAVTTDLFAALAVGDVLVACTAPCQQTAFAAHLLPLIEPRHTLILPAGGLASLRYAKWLRDRGWSALPTFVETDTVLLVAVREAPDGVRILATPTDPGVGVFPAERTEGTIPDVQRLFPGTRAVPHVLAAALAGVMPFLRAPALLLNAAVIERSRGGFALFEDGFTLGVARVAEALDAERRAIGAALRLDLADAAATLHELGLSPLGDLWEAVNGSHVLTRESVWGEEAGVALASGPAEVAFILQPWVQIGSLLGVDVSVARGLLACAEAASAEVRDGVAAQIPGWSLRDLGLDGMTADALTRFLETGRGEPLD